MLKILDSATETGPGNAVRSTAPHRAFHVYVDETGSPDAQVDIEVANEAGGPWAVLHSFDAITDSEGAEQHSVTAPFVYVRANLKSVSSNGEAVTVTMEAVE